MNYISIFFLLWFLIIYSNYLNLRFKIKFNESFFLSICILILSSFFLIKLDYNLTKFLFEYILIFFCIISVVFIPNLLTNINKINLKLNFEFIFLFILIFLLTKDRYYLDQDEFAYWGMSLKAFPLSEPFRSFGKHFDHFFVSFDHHPQGLDLFRYVLSSPKFSEGIVIFSNNVILISGFYFLFYERKLIFLEKLLLFVIYYLLLNNLSFGFISIYADPILAVFYACLLKKVFLISNKKDFKLDYSFILIFITLFLVKRSSVIYGFYILYFFIGFSFLNYFREYQKKKSLYLYITILISLSILILFLPKILPQSYQLSINNILNIFLSYEFYLKLYKFVISPIYFSQFGVTLNGIINIIFSSSFNIYEFKIPLVFYLIFLTPLLFFKFNFRWFIFISSILIILIHMSIILITKTNFENLHISALPRYIGIILISKYLFLISIIIYKYKLIHKNFIILFLILCFSLVTPKKSLGFFVPDSIYYKDLSNKRYKDNRNQISKLNLIKNNYQEIIIVYEDGFSDFNNAYVTGEHTFYNNIIRYELFPKQPKFIEYNKFIKNEKKYSSSKNLIILFDLNNDTSQKINTADNIIKIKTYNKKKDEI